MFLSIVATAGLSLVLYLTGFFVIFSPLPFLFTILKRGYLPAFAASILSLAALGGLYRLAPESVSFLPMMVFYPYLSMKVLAGFSLLYFFYYVWMGWLVAWASQRTSPWGSLEKGIAGLTVLTLAVPAAVGIVFTSRVGFHLPGDFSAALHYLLQKMMELQKSAGGNPEELMYLKTYAPTIVRRVMGVMPGLWINFTLMVLSLNILFLRRWMRDQKPFPSWVEFSKWRLGESWIWLPIASGGLYFFNLYIAGSTVLGLIAVNLLLVLGAVYFLQGLAVVSFFFRSKLSPWTRFAAYAAILIFIQVAGVLVMGLGIFDFWFDFRKLKKVN